MYYHLLQTTKQNTHSMLQVTIACNRGIIGQTHSEDAIFEIGGVVKQSNETVCRMFKTCADCTAVSQMCQWSLVKQSCNEILAAATTTTMSTMETTKTTETNIRQQQKRQVATAINSTNDPYDSPGQSQLEIQDNGSCPTFNVNYTKLVSKEYMLQVVQVDVNNDTSAVGYLTDLLNQSRIDCYLNGKTFVGVTAKDGHQILCNTTDTKTEYDRRMSITDQPSAITYFSASMNGVPMEFNRVQDHYLAVYRIDECHANVPPSESKCVSCFWDDDVYRYYCRLCIQNDDCTGQYEYCDIRWLGNFTLANSVDNVRVRCPDVRIESVDPLYAPWAGGTTVRITVTNNKVLFRNKVVVVTVAGHRCLLPTITTDGTQISCMIAPTNSSQLNDGPVEVSYVSDLTESSLPVLTLQSDQTFYFVDPEISSVQPTCGRMAGGTLLTIRGNFLNAGNTAKAFIGENVTCEITARDQNSVTCVTGSSKTPAVGDVRLEFDTYLKKYAAQSVLFEYTGEPAVDANQTFRGIAMGGTRLPVRGRYFKCIEHPFVHVSYMGIQHTGTCNVMNDTYMECRSPTINRPAPYMVMDLKFGFQADFDKSILKLLPPPGSPDYQLFPDPIYLDFQTDRTGRIVTINGLHLNQGYHLSDDLSIRLRNSTIACNITAVKSQRIVCRAPIALRPSSPSLKHGNGNRTNHDILVVSFGDKLVYEVRRKIPLSYRNSPLNLTILFSGITIVSLIITFIVAVVYCMRIALLSSTQQTEMQSLCEQQQHISTTIPEQCKEVILENCRI